jgi:hypothetical protein
MAVDPAQHPTMPIQNSSCDFSSVSLWPWAARIIAWHPRRSSLMDPLSDLEERKTLILLGVVGAVVAEVPGSSQTLAFAIFGIGALLRFRTVLDNPNSPGKPLWWWWLGWLVAWDHGRWQSLSPLSAGFSPNGSIHMRGAGSGSDSLTT